MTTCQLSIVLPVFNDQENLTRILSELASNQSQDNWEVLVVDDGSSIPLQLPLDTPQHWQLIRHDQRQGAASARNTAIKKAKGEYISFLSVFLGLPADYVGRILQFVKTHAFDVAQHLLQKKPDLPASHFQSFLVDQVNRQHAHPTVKQTQFAAAIIKRETFMSAGGFDENMNHYGGHELDLAYRLDQQGFSRRTIVPDLPLDRVTLESHVKVRSRLKEYGQVGLPSLLSKHPELKTTILVSPVVWAMVKMLGMPKRMEHHFSQHIEQDDELATWQYRLYLHLIVRNAWDAR